MNHLSALERYNEYRDIIQELLSSIITGIHEDQLIRNEAALFESMQWLHKNYPFVELIYTLDANGIQSSNNISSLTEKTRAPLKGKGIDRSHRPYYQLATNKETSVATEPYLSSDSHRLCISSAIRCVDDNDGSLLGVLVIDIDLANAIEFLMGDTHRKKFQPLFVSVYAMIVIGLFFVVGILLYTAGVEAKLLLLSNEPDDLHSKPFGIIIFLTLALAIFDLGKTTLEEEILMKKDIFRHSSTRRTITRFIAAILIAVSIESLLLMFKSVLGEPQYLMSAVAMMATAIGLLIGLGIYVYLGAHAESVLKQSINKTLVSDK